MKKPTDTYVYEKTINMPGCVAKIYRPVITDEERARRMKIIHDAAADVIKDCIKKGIEVETC